MCCAQAIMDQPLKRGEQPPGQNTLPTDRDDLESGIQVQDLSNGAEEAKNELDEVREILAQLRKWHNWDVNSRQSLRKYLLNIMFPRRPPRPSPEELKRLAKFFFPVRGSLIATVCDYGDGRFEDFETCIDQIDPSWFILYLFCD